MNPGFAGLAEAEDCVVERVALNALVCAFAPILKPACWGNTRHLLDHRPPSLHQLIVDQFKRLGAYTALAAEGVIHHGEQEDE